MKRNVLFFVILLFFPLSLISQHVASSVISAQGGHSQKGNITFDWTLGETFTGTIAQGERLITQGFQQPSLSITSIKTGGASFDIYPNPVSGVLTIRNTDGCDQSFTVRIYDGNVALIKSLVISPFNSEVHADMTDLMSGMYQLHILDNHGAIIATLRIIKY